MNLLHLFRPIRPLACVAGKLEVVLRANRPLRLQNARGRRVRCISGCAWLTAPGLTDDIFLYADESWEVATDGLVLIEAAASTAVALVV